jgi:hypothetical protein
MILGARSAYFRAMLFDHQGRTVEARQGYVEVVDFDAVVVRALVEFIYTGTVNEYTYINA